MIGDRVENQDESSMWKRRYNKYGNELINIVKTLTNYLIIYMILIVLIIFYPSLIGKKEPSNDREYIPRRKRNIWHKAMKTIASQIQKLCNGMIGASERIKTKRKIKERIGAARKWREDPPKANRKLGLILSVTSAIAMYAGHNDIRDTDQRRVTFDSDSGSIGIDNRCSACISHRIEDFIGTPSETRRTIKGFGGTRTSNVMIGTLLWRWSDDSGKIHKFKIPNSYYVPEGGVRLLSPQHWAQTQRKQYGKNTQYGCNTRHDRVTMYWDNGTKYESVVPIGKSNNVATFNLAPGYDKFALFCEEAKIDYDEEQENPIVTCMPAEALEEQSNHGTTDESNKEVEWPEMKTSINESTDKHFSLKGTENSSHEKYIDEDLRTEGTENRMAAEFLELHQRYGHISFQRLIEMSKQGIINKRFARCPIPTCSTCMFAKATKKRWRDKPRKDYEPKAPKQPGLIVSVDQLVSPTPGLVAQMTGKLTTKRYRYATVFVDQKSRFGYVHLQKTATAE